MSDIKIVGWPKRPAEQRRDELEAENAELKSANEALKVFISGQESELIRVTFELSDAKTELAEARVEIERKDKLIEQMREAIKFSLIADEVRQTRNVCASDINDACETSKVKRIASLSAAERGGR